jgi:parvulin-like peptidyl-prolyl isomerase
MMLFGCVGLIPVSATGQDESEVAATVGNAQITVGQVERKLKLTLGKRKLEPEAREILFAATLRQLVNQLVVVEYLQETKHSTNNDQLNLEIERLKLELAKTETSLEDFLKDRRQTLAELKQQIRWQRSWALFLRQSLNEENLQRFFDSHQKDFDGTQLRVAHLLLPRPQDGGNNQDAIVKLTAKAQKIRGEITDGSLSWSEAVKEHSSGESVKDEGDIGWIERRKPMPQVFADAAFKLEKDEISPPVETKFGVHLIKCLEVKRGRKKLAAVRKEVQAEATKFLFDWVLEQQAGKSKVRYTGNAPYFDPQTQKLMKRTD